MDTSKSQTRSDSDPIVVLASDDRFAMPLAATVRSALDNLDARRRLRIFVLDGGLSDASKQRLAASWPRGRFAVDWINVDISAIADVPVSGHINLVSYYRLLIPRVLPAEVSRAIYLDADLIIRADLGRLWDHELHGQACLAAVDCSAPVLDAELTLANFTDCGPHLSATRPVPNYHELGMRPHAAYFNAGVLFADLDAWRGLDVTRKAIECLEQNRQHVRWWDQYALNVVLADRWGRFDMRWNQGTQAFKYPSWQQSPFDQSTLDTLKSDPWIIHYTTPSKPWHPLCPHPLRGEYEKYVARTQWAGWRPPRMDVVRAVMKQQERRFRHGRRWLKQQAIGWFDRRTQRRAA